MPRFCNLGTEGCPIRHEMGGDGRCWNLLGSARPTGRLSLAAERRADLEQARHEGAAAAGGLLLMALAINETASAREFDAWEAAACADAEEAKARYEEDLRREREAWKYARPDDGDGE